MKTVIAMTLLSLVTGLAHAQESCASKEADILRQLEHAREQGNTGRIEGLETALGKVRAHCTDAGLQAERQEEIDEAREEIREREAELQEALREGDPKQIEKRERKLAEAREELREVLED
ncbi:DUF1090 domain-containing protein [Stutzerimonas stutzeri]|uniref:DUF1090 domain-containing protein n=1 Tax=Stutzerimonas stutzeri TaxID=316 RepID=UPI0015E326C6|nr:DUF1090 domain-containing protein [Stutzerimonas stutzeri]MBA1261841.1 DUF1090 domain-containing protein [Stutzerimonas stutzeri]